MMSDLRTACIEEVARMLAEYDWALKHPAMGEDAPVEERHRAAARIAFDTVTHHLRAAEVSGVEDKWKSLTIA